MYSHRHSPFHGEGVEPPRADSESAGLPVSRPVSVPRAFTTRRCCLSAATRRSRTASGQGVQRDGTCRNVVPQSIPPAVPLPRCCHVSLLSDVAAVAPHFHAGLRERIHTPL